METTKSKSIGNGSLVYCCCKNGLTSFCVLDAVFEMSMPATNARQHLCEFVSREFFQPRPGSAGLKAVIFHHERTSAAPSYLYPRA